MPRLPRAYTWCVADDFDATVVPAPRATVDEPEPATADIENTLIVETDLERPERPSAAQPAQATAQYYQFRVGARTEAITLDRPCFIGRRPASPRIVRGPAPRLLRVPSPLKEVSATHIELRQLGSSVIVTDLKSTNGSIVMVPGSVPRKLRQGESVVISPGTLVDIGDDNVLQILPMQRLAVPDDAEPFL
ncbi:MAG: hypothetical protein JWP19_795 [Rhodoglobus sp.]|nr:hypothetical protein [Rhodoglobus sp.]